MRDFRQQGPRPIPEQLFNVEAEQAVLGALLAENQEFFSLPDGLSPEHFYDPGHARMFRLMAEKIGAGEEANLYSLSALFPGAMVDEDDAARLGTSPCSWAQYLANLTDAAITVFHVRDYAEMVMRQAEARDLFWAAEDAQFALLADIPEGRGPEKAAAPLVDRIMSIGASSARTRFTLESAFEEAVRAADAARTGEGMTSTGFRDLDELLGGWAPTRLTICAGRPGMGKTALALALGLNAARRGVGVIFVSLEMTAAHIGQRLLSAVAAVDGMDLPYATLSRGKHGAADVNAVLHVSATAKNHPFLILENLRSVGEITTAVQRQKQAWEAQGIRLGLVVVDYLQLLKPPRERRDNRVNEITDISISLKHLAMKLGVNVLALSQLSRAVESRDDKRPQLSDLRDSGAIEQDADAVLLLLREEYYLQKERDQDDEWAAKLAEVKNLIAVHVAKNRHGPEGEAVLFCDIARNHFSDLARGSHAQGGGYGRF